MIRTSRSDDALLVSWQVRERLMSLVDPQEVLVLLRKDLGIRQDDLGRACGVSARSVRTWEGGGPMRRRHQERVVALGLVAAELLRALEPAGVELWLRLPHRALQRRSPVEALGVGADVDVWAAVESTIGGAHE